MVKEDCLVLIQDLVEYLEVTFVCQVDLALNLYGGLLEAWDGPALLAFSDGLPITLPCFVGMVLMLYTLI